MIAQNSCFVDFVLAGFVQRSRGGANASRGVVRITTPKGSLLDRSVRSPTYNAKVICVSTSAASAHSEESDTPRRRTPLRIGNWAASNSALIDAKVEQSEIGATRDRLRVMMWKSANLTLIVTVRPRCPYRKPKTAD
jgi:hypothetical protein